MFSNECLCITGVNKTYNWNWNILLLKKGVLKIVLVIILENITIDIRII